MREKMRRLLAFPYPVEYEPEFRRHIVRMMYRPLFIVVSFVQLLVFFLVIACVLWPDVVAPPEYIHGIFLIDTVFCGVTLCALILSTVLHRYVYEHPRAYMVLCNGYAVCICLWASALSAYASYSDIVYTAFVYVCLCTSLVAQLKPWQAVLMFGGNFAVYAAMLDAFNSSGRDPLTNQLNAVLAVGVSIAISSALYRSRARTFYGRLIITRQNDEIHSINEKLRQLVHTDELTGMYNRRYYEEELPERLRAISEAGELACGMMMDVDNFKDYNDRYGHQAGDLCLRRVAATLRDAVPEGAFIVRYGGEEFYLLVSMEAEHGLTLAEALRGAIAEEYIPHLDSATGHVTISVGLALCPPGECDLDALTRRADQALYEAKGRGRNRVAVWEG
ncbi:GGDEF domain-containing protein, partial [Eubacteriales bacterium OttesenSCG-928-A19]|nr:GGDEF domain-containing protein [Eubacteriales bacterium OttesenSCG-928-A19]